MRWEVRKMVLGFCKLSDRICLIFAYIACGFLFLSVFLISYGAVFRYFGFATNGLDELGGYAMVGIAFLPVGLVTNIGQHITVDILVSRLNVRAQNLLFISSNLVIGLCLSGVLLYSAIWLVRESYFLDSVSVVLRVPLFLPQILIVAGTGIFILALIANLLKRILEELPPDL